MTTQQLSLTKPTDLRERIAQLVVPRIGSNMIPPCRVEDDEDRVARVLDECPVGGLILFNGTWPTSRDVLDRLQAKSHIPLLVGSDIERGAGQQVAGLSVFPHQRAFVDLPDAAEAVTRFCQVTAREARAAGIHAIYGPVADVNTDPRNPIIANRAFGDDPAKASELVAAYVRAAEGAGLVTTAKHFPGHGDTHQDSHDSMPRVDLPREQLLRREMAPFRAAVDAGCSMVMSAHVEYPALDPTGAPATLSRPILVDLLRGEMGFEGVVCSDSLMMGSMRDRLSSEAEIVIQSLAAGVDLLLDMEDAPAAVESIARAVESGRVPEHRVDEALDRVWRLKERIFTGAESVKPTPEGLASAGAEALEIAKSATRVSVSEGALALPLPRNETLTALLLKPHHRVTDPPEQPLGAALRDRFAAVRYFERGPEADESLAADLLAGSPEGAPILVTLIVKPAAWHAFGLAESQHALVNRLIAERPCVVASLGVESALDAYAGAPVRVCTHSDAPCSQEALAGLLARV